MLENPREKLAEHKTRITITAVMLMGMVAQASAIDFDAIISLVDEIVLIMPFMVDMVIAAIPIIVVIALAAFIVGFLNKIVSKIG